LPIIGRCVSIGAPLVGENVVGVLVASRMLVVANCVIDVGRSWWAQRWVVGVLPFTSVAPLLLLIAFVALPLLLLLFNACTITIQG